MNATDADTLEDNRATLHRIKFWILLVLDIPSVLLYFLIFVFFITHRTLLRVIQHRGLFVLLFINFFEAFFGLPMNIHFFYRGRVSPATAVFCTWWNFFDYILNVSSQFLMAAISVQRHILVFNRQILGIRIKRLLLHDLPLFLCVAYPTCIYLGLIVMYPCDGTQWDFSSNMCGNANCYLVYSTALGVFDWAAHSALPVVLIPVANVILIIRVVWQKHRCQQPILWRKQRRMTVQLACISCLYLIAWLPCTTVAVIQQFITSSFINDIQTDYLFSLTYLVSLLTPYVCFGMLPQLNKWVWKQLRP